ncbi:MAG: 50S ribosomal protein L29 [Candidatus Shapirobacteria bacterium]
MKKKERQELVNKTTAELRQMRAELVMEITRSRRDKSWREMRKDIARIATELHKKELKNETA